MDRPRLSTLLSWALVAFTIEADNEFELSVPHVTSAERGNGLPVRGPWLASLTMWYSCLQFVPDDGIALTDLERLTFDQCRLRGTNPGMVRWGYVTVDDGVVRRTAAGTTAASTWATLSPAIEQRWAARHGSRDVSRLRAALEAAVDAIGTDLPDAVPENAARGGRLTLHPGTHNEPDSGPRDLAALIAKVLVQRTLSHEATSLLALSYAANPVRALGAGPVTVRDLPRLTGVGKETLAVMTNWLRKRELARVSGTGTAKTIALTAPGRTALQEYVDAPGGGDSDLRGALEPITAELEVTAPPGCWRARRRRPDTLPHHPVISHRGGYPEGS